MIWMRSLIAGGSRILEVLLLEAPECEPLVCVVLEELKLKIWKKKCPSSDELLLLLLLL